MLADQQAAAQAKSDADAKAAEDAKKTADQKAADQAAAAKVASDDAAGKMGAQNVATQQAQKFNPFHVLKQASDAPDISQYAPTPSNAMNQVAKVAAQPVQKAEDFFQSYGW